MRLGSRISQLIRLLRYAKRMYIAVSHPVFLVNCELGCEQGRIVVSNLLLLSSGATLCHFFLVLD
jgi:hypothetical protein